MPHQPTTVLGSSPRPVSGSPSCPKQPPRWLSALLFGLLLGPHHSQGGEPSTEVPSDATPIHADKLRPAAERALRLLELSSAGSAEQRTCFTCHSQAHPVLAIVAAKQRGFTIDDNNLANQIRHTAEHLNRGRNDYLEGRGQGGKADTAGYALWTLRSGDFSDPAATAPVVAWLRSQQLEAGNWKRSSDRPPSEASHFTTTYVALRGLLDFATADQPMDSSPVDRADPESESASDSQTVTDPTEEAGSAFQNAEAIRRVRDWLVETPAKDTEDRVFRLLALRLTDAPKSTIAGAAHELLQTQRDDGGWAQIEELDSDAYATGTALYALQQTNCLAPDSPEYQNGLRFLLRSQHEDGSWHVTSRSRPFQGYYETGFPHGKDQFISTSATAWATLAILSAYAEEP